MMEKIEKIEALVEKTKIDTDKVKEIQLNFIKNELKAHHYVDNYIGDYPTFIEPVYIGTDVKIGDDVLIGPNVYIGNNCEIGDYGELVNTILLDNVILGENFKLENCVVAKGSELKFNKLNASNCILKGKTDSEKKLEKVSF